MIIYGLITVIFAVITVVFSGLTVPGLPDEAAIYLDEFIKTLENAKGLFNLVFPINVLPFILICLAITAAHHVYAFAMWVLRKIPLLSIE